MIINIILAITGTIIITCLVNLLLDRKGKIPDSISIRESMDLCNLPVVTFLNNGNKYNFVLDSGANQCHVSEEAVKSMTSEDTDNEVHVQGFSGEAEPNKGKVIDLIYKDKVFTTEVFVSPSLDKSFRDIKKNMGVTLHGIIGSDFLKKYGYVLDFYRLIAYYKE